MTAAIQHGMSVTYGSVAIASIAAAVGNNAVYTLEAGQDTGWIKTGIILSVNNCTNSVNDGELEVVSLSGVTLTLVNSAAINEAASPGFCSFLVGGTSDFQLHDFHSSDIDYENTLIRFAAVFVGAASEAVFVRWANALEAAFRIPYQRLRVVVGSTVEKDYNPAAESGGNTGFLMQPASVKPGDAGRDSDRSRRYDIEITMKRPADLAGKNGLRDASILVQFRPRGRLVTITGTYTALGANNAKAVYDNDADTLSNGILDTYGGNALYEILDEQTTGDDEDKELRFSRIYQEIIYNQSASGLDHAAIVDPAISYARREEAPGDGAADVERLKTIDVLYDSEIEADETTDLVTLWTGTIEPYILAQAKAIFSGGAVAIVGKNVQYHKASNRLTAFLVLQVAAGSGLYEYTKTIEVSDLSGKQLVPAWDGNPLAKHVYQGPARRLRTTMESMLTGPAGGSGGSGAGSGVFVISPARGNPLAVGAGIFGPSANELAAAFGFGGRADPANMGIRIARDGADENDGGQPAGQEGQPEEGWVEMERTSTETPEFRGFPGDQIELQRTSRVLVEEWVEAPAGGGGDVATPGGGGGVLAGAAVSFQANPAAGS